MFELMEPECESKLVALALQHLAQGWVATEENCDLSEKKCSNYVYHKLTVCVCGGWTSHLANLLLSDLCKHLGNKYVGKCDLIR